MQQSSNEANAQGVYVIVNLHTGNFVAEVLTAGWDKLNEVTGAALPISNASETNIDLRNQVKVQGGTVIEVDHSRGSLTSSIATVEQIKRGTTQAVIGSVTFNGGAANAQRMADRVDTVTGGTGQIFEATHPNDWVGNTIGGNATQPGNPVSFGDAHSLYTGFLPPEKLQNSNEPNPMRVLTNEAWGEGKTSQPVKVAPSIKEVSK
jgi:filamentous hemagglutinin